MKSAHYSNIARILHWLVAGLIISQYGLAELAEMAKQDEKVLVQLALLANHKSIGMTILMLAIIRLIYRVKNPAPPLPMSMPKWQITASHVSHWVLYSALFALPITGWLMSSATAYSVSWFNLFTFPDLLAPNESVAELLKSTHYWLGEILFVLAILHIAAAFKHHFIDKDTVLTRMAGIRNWLLFLITIALTLAIFSQVGTDKTTPNDTVNTPSTTPATTAKNSTLPAWQIDYQRSYIRFSGEQAGAPFAGEWQTWNATLQFDHESLGESQFDVVIEIDSVFSNDTQRDDYIRSADFFDTQQFSQARYLASDFETTDDGFVANGILTAKGLSKALPLMFTIAQQDQQITLSGTAIIDRLAWNIGTGDWSNTTWVGQNVEVDVRVTATTQQ